MHRFATSNRNDTSAVQTLYHRYYLGSSFVELFHVFNYIYSFQSNFAGYLKEYIITVRYYRSWNDDIGICHDSHYANTNYFVPSNAFLLG